MRSVAAAGDELSVPRKSTVVARWDNAALIPYNLQIIVLGVYLDSLG
jgi:hypothetical protein